GAPTPDAGQRRVPISPLGRTPTRPTAGNAAARPPLAAPPASSPLPVDAPPANGTNAVAAVPDASEPAPPQHSAPPIAATTAAGEPQTPDVARSQNVAQHADSMTE